MPSDQPNVLFLLSDEHSFRCFSHLDPAVGEPAETPAFDRLATEGTAFENAYCHVPLCTPSRISMLTGREAQHTGAWTNESFLEPQFPTLPGQFSDAGYETCLVGKMHLAGDRQFVGFDHRPYGDLTGGNTHQMDGPNLDAGLGHGSTYDVGQTMIPESLLMETNVAEETVAFLREQDAANPEQPWFLCASFSRPHFPLTAPKRHLDKYWPDDVPPPKVSREETSTADHPQTVAMLDHYAFDDMDETDLRKARAAYFAAVDYLDEVIGDLLLRLERSGLLENTIVVYTSDHGELAGEHGLWWKHTWQEASSRVPLFVQLPEHRSGELDPTRPSTPVSLLDLFPTFCGLAGIDYPDSLDGVDLSEAIRTGSEPERGPVFCDHLRPGQWDFRAVRDGRYKYVQFPDAPELLFDLDADPLETENLAPTADGEDEAALERLRALVDRTFDFEAARERRALNIERKERDHSLSLPARPLGERAHDGSGNLYHLPDGRIVAADSPLYDPHVLTADPRSVFSDWPDEE
ncbi:sulfatase-like hydrolase/transferase [Halovenus marina]|uniref:sulfatase-like hydrolase/transferase n=1 Tax=Halovenus marina TaxID=3396621 RepID=UPI003F579B7D